MFMPVNATAPPQASQGNLAVTVLLDAYRFICSCPLTQQLFSPGISLSVAVCHQAFSFRNAAEEVLDICDRTVWALS